jgi:hypothetical protein
MAREMKLDRQGTILARRYRASPLGLGEAARCPRNGSQNESFGSIGAVVSFKFVNQGCRQGRQLSGEGRLNILDLEGGSALVESMTLRETG